MPTTLRRKRQSKVEKNKNACNNMYHETLP